MSTLKVTNIQSNGSGFNDVVSFQNSVGTQNGTLCRAWVNFNGDLAGTKPFTSSGGIRASFNVSSITYNSNGTYTINFQSSMPDINYCSCGNFGLEDPTRTYAERPGGIQITSMTTNSIRLTPLVCSASANTDPQVYAAPYIHVSIFR